MVKVNTLVVGGGLAGLSLARALVSHRKESLHLVEARDRFGGRILSRRVAGASGSAVFDLGPTWFWQGQPRIDALVEHLGLARFDQFASGDLVYQDERGLVHRGRGFSSMQGSLRLNGGLGAVIDALAEPLAPFASLNTKVTTMTYAGDAIESVVVSPDGAARIIESDCVVLALPPRVAAEAIEFGGGISEVALEAMRAIPTWMAGHAKVVSVYERPFWRDEGLSGDVMSRRGPIVEVHDASPASGGPFALFGFLGVSAEARKRHGNALAELIKDQLAQLFGNEAGDPIDLLLKDWAFDDETATDLDRVQATGHPSYGLPAALSNLWDGRLIFGSTEVGSEFGGYLEGALEAAENAAAHLGQWFARTSAK